MDLVRSFSAGYGILCCENRFVFGVFAVSVLLKNSRSDRVPVVKLKQHIGEPDKFRREYNKFNRVTS